MTETSRLPRNGHKGPIAAEHERRPKGETTLALYPGRSKDFPRLYGFALEIPGRGDSIQIVTGRVDLEGWLRERRDPLCEALRELPEATKFVDVAVVAPTRRRSTIRALVHAKVREIVGIAVVRCFKANMSASGLGEGPGSLVERANQAGDLDLEVGQELEAKAVGLLLATRFYTAPPPPRIKRQAFGRLMKEAEARSAYRMSVATRTIDDDGAK